MEEKLTHVRNNVNPTLWAETFADDEDFHEAGYQPGDEVKLFASDEAGQLAKQRLALLELVASKAAPPKRVLALVVDARKPDSVNHFSIGSEQTIPQPNALNFGDLLQIDIGCLADA